MDLESLLLSAATGVLAFVAIFSFSAALRKNRFGERHRGRAERIGCGLLGLLMILIIVEIVLIARAQ